MPGTMQGEGADSGSPWGMAMVYDMECNNWKETAHFKQICNKNRGWIWEVPSFRRS